MPTAAFTLQHRSWVVKTTTFWLTKLKIFIILWFTDKHIANPSYILMSKSKLQLQQYLDDSSNMLMRESDTYVSYWSIWSINTGQSNLWCWNSGQNLPEWHWCHQKGTGDVFHRYWWCSTSGFEHGLHQPVCSLCKLYIYDLCTFPYVCHMCVHVFLQ